MNPISTLVTILIVIAFFGVMIFVHELGHFLAAHACKVKVLEFALGMGPKLIKFRSKKSGTLYSLRALPVGGFCSMLGENDDGGNEEGALCRRPRWQRFLVLFAGSFMNLFTAFLAMFIVVASSGVYLSNTVDGFYIPSYAKGVQVGDIIEKVGDTEVHDATQIEDAIRALDNNLCTFSVLRGSETILIENVSLPQVYEDGTFQRQLDFVVGEDESAPTEVSRYKTPSAEAGLKSGDRILSVNGKPIHVYTDITWEIALAGNDPCSLNILRDDESIVISGVVFPVTSEKGVVLGSADFALRPVPLNGFFDTLSQTALQSISTIKIIYRSLVELIAGRFGTAGVSGPVGAAETISQAASYGFISLLYIFVFISMNLGVFNLLPLPALDGGRLLFLIIEMIRRKPINQKYEGLIHFIGLIVFLALMAVITVMDVTRLIAG